MLMDTNDNVETTKIEQEETGTQSLTDMSERQPILQQLGVLALILLLIFGTGYIPKVKQALEENRNNTASVPVTQENEVPTEPEKNNTFEEVAIRGDAAFVFDVSNNKILYEKNAYEQLPLASITKLMTALVAYELLAENTEIPVTVAAILQDGSSGLSDGESFTLGNILDLTLLSSSNDGAYAIAAAVGSQIVTEGDAGTFVEAMNIKADELGLTETYFRNPTGLDISRNEAGAYGSARDVAFLMKHILTHYPNIIEKTTTSQARITNDQGSAHQVENTNPVVESIDGLIGSKTGYTELAGGNLAIAFDAAYNRPIVVVVLGSTYNARFDDVLALTDAARKAIQ